MISDYRGYSLFKDVRDPLLRAWNRAAVMKNILEQAGPATVEGYTRAIPKEELTAVSSVLLAVKKRGVDAVRREVTRNRGYKNV